MEQVIDSIGHWSCFYVFSKSRLHWCCSHIGILMLCLGLSSAYNFRVDPAKMADPLPSGSPQEASTPEVVQISPTTELHETFR